MTTVFTFGSSAIAVCASIPAMRAIQPIVATPLNRFIFPLISVVTCRPSREGSITEAGTDHHVVTRRAFRGPSARRCRYAFRCRAGRTLAAQKLGWQLTSRRHTTEYGQLQLVLPPAGERKCCVWGLTHSAESEAA